MYSKNNLTRYRFTFYKLKPHTKLKNVNLATSANLNQIAPLAFTLENQIHSPLVLTLETH